jgi:hypothetical protein
MEFDGNLGQRPRPGGKVTIADGARVTIVTAAVCAFLVGANIEAALRNSQRGNDAGLIRVVKSAVS